MGKNWNSKIKTFTEIKGEKAIAKSKIAQDLKSKGFSVTEISKKLEVSKSRVYEYLRQ